MLSFFLSSLPFPDRLIKLLDSYWSVMSLASVVVLYMLTMLTITHADRSRPTLKDDERFRNGLVCDLNEFTMNAKLFMNAKSIYMNAKRTKLNLNINLKTMLYENSCYIYEYAKI